MTAADGAWRGRLATPGFILGGLLAGIYRSTSPILQVAHLLNAAGDGPSRRLGPGMQTASWSADDGDSIVLQNATGPHQLSTDSGGFVVITNQNPDRAQANGIDREPGERLRGRFVQECRLSGNNLSCAALLIKRR
jgi:hypothetical protein